MLQCGRNEWSGCVPVSELLKVCSQATYGAMVSVVPGVRQEFPAVGGEPSTYEGQTRDRGQESVAIACISNIGQSSQVRGRLCDRSSKERTQHGEGLGEVAEQMCAREGVVVSMFHVLAVRRWLRQRRASRCAWTGGCIELLLAWCCGDRRQVLL